MAGKRLPEPPQLRLLKGVRPGRDSGGRKVKAPPSFQRTTPKPPTWLSREAAAEWNRVVPGLQRLDILKEEDRAALTAYCETWSVFVDATRTVQREGLTTTTAAGGIKPHPAVGIARTAGRELRSYAALFGLSPAAESALGAAPGPNDDDENPFA